MSPQPRAAGGPRQDDAGGRDRVEDRTRRRISRATSQEPDGAREALQPDQRRHRAEWRHLRRRRLRLVLRESVHQQGRVHPVVRRPRLRAGKARRATRHLGRHARRAAPSSSWPIAATTACSDSRWTGSTSTSSRASGCPAISTSVKGLVVIPDLHGRVTLMDKTNALVAQLGDSNAAELEQPAPARTAGQVHPRPVHLPARRLLRSRRQHLRRRMGRGGAGDEAAESRVASNKPGTAEIS